MSTSQNPRREHPSTYWVQDRSNEDERTRVMIQDQLLTAGMGGVLPEQPDPTIFKRVLDVGCGTGGWLIETATTYPTISLLVGVDVSKRIVEYAREQAEAQHVNDRVEFHVMDALRMLEFPAQFFDLVNHRLGVSYLRTWDWPNLLTEYQRVCRPGGVVRVTETDLVVENNSPALMRLHHLTLDAIARAGHLFTPASDGITSQLERLLNQYNLQNVQSRVHTIEYRAGTPEGRHFFDDNKHAYRTFLPFLRKWGKVPDDYEEIYQQALVEMQQPGFVANWRLVTAWGTTPLQ